MANIDNELIGSRIRELRNFYNYTQPELFRMVRDYLKSIDDNSYDLYDDEVGKQTLSQIENGSRGLKPNIIRAYATVLNTTIDYLMGRINDWKMEYKDVKEVIGLSDEAINKLENANTQNKSLISSLDKLICNNYFIDLLGAINEYKVLKKKIILEKAPHILNTVDDMRKYRLLEEYKKSDFIQLKPEDALFLSEYKINSIFNKLTNSMLNGGDK